MLSLPLSFFFKLKGMPELNFSSCLIALYIVVPIITTINVCIIIHSSPFCPLYSSDVLPILLLIWWRKQKSMKLALSYLLSHIPSILFHHAPWLALCECSHVILFIAFQDLLSCRQPDPCVNRGRWRMKDPEQLKVWYRMNASHDIDGLLFLCCKLGFLNNDLSPADNTMQCRFAETIGVSVLS